MSIIGVPMLLGPILGPILGGWLVADVSWRWIFFINVPIGIIALVAALRVLPRDVPAHGQRFDLVDLLLLSPGLAPAIYGLAETNSAGGFGSPKVLIPLIAGLALIAAFVWHALRARDPLIDLRVLAAARSTTAPSTRRRRSSAGWPPTRGLSCASPVPLLVAEPGRAMVRLGTSDENPRPFTWTKTADRSSNRSPAAVGELTTHGTCREAPGGPVILTCAQPRYAVRRSRRSAK